MARSHAQRQKALQNLLHAEATSAGFKFALGISSGGGGAGGGAGRDLASLSIWNSTRKKVGTKRRGPGRPASRRRKKSPKRSRARSACASPEDWPSSRAITRKAPRGAGNRKCSAARRESCNARWSRWPATTAERLGFAIQCAAARKRRVIFRLIGGQGIRFFRTIRSSGQSAVEEIPAIRASNDRWTGCARRPTTCAAQLLHNGAKLKARHATDR